MKRCSASLPMLAAIVLVCTFCASFALAQDAAPSARPMFATMPPHSYSTPNAAPAANLAQWNGAWTHKGQRTTFVMVGADPRQSNATTTIPTFIIPIKFVYGAQNGNMTFDPTLNTNFGSMSTVTMIQGSPLMQSNVHFIQGGTDLGTTQYLDAYQRANFWSVTKTKTGYHTLLGTPVVLPTQTITVTPSQGSVIANPFLPGKKVGTMDINAFDVKLQGFMAALTQIQPNTFPIFVGYDIYLTSGGCCIGGYHSANSGPPAGQTYAFSSQVDQGNQVFSQDVAALSHEIGEWYDDPFTNNRVPCTDNSILENGDPLVLHDFPYNISGFNYHLQDLVFIDYFGAPKTIPVNNWLSFQNDEKNTCPGLP
jgi:hypothetical protein